MKKVSIRTAQNIEIDYRIAGLGLRMFAFLIDILILTIGLGILTPILIPFSEYLAIIPILIFVLYTPLCEIFWNGQTIGKRAMRLRVVNLSGRQPVVLDFMIRWAFRLVDIYFTLGSMAVVLISSTPRGQRMGGILSNTIVINLKGEVELSITDILRIEDRTNYQPTYPEVYRFNEAEMLTVKSVLERTKRYPNPAHKQVLRDTAQRCAQILEIDENQTKPAEFLHIVLRDYIVLTRS